MSQTVLSSRPFQSEKTNVLGELAVRLKKSSLSDDPSADYPPPPPVFQTYAKQLSGNSEDHEVSSVSNGSAERSSSSLSSKSSNFGSMSRSNSLGLFNLSGPPKAPPPPSSAFKNNNNNSGLNSISEPPKAPSVPIQSSLLKTNNNSGLISLSGSQKSEPQLALPTKYIHKKCSGCGLAVVTGGGYANGQLYHQDCFKCYNCKCKLDAKFSSAEGNILCQDCFKFYEKMCGICQGTISKDCVESNGKFYHGRCMKCGECKQLLDGMYYLLMGRFLCERDYNRLKKKCNDCGILIDGLYYSDNNNKTLCEVCYKKTLGKCKRCNGVLEGNLLKIPGASFHTDCFRCKICDISLAGSNVMTDEDREIYCNKCYDQLFAEKCYACKKPIVPKDGSNIAPKLKALDQNYHPECFKCQSCGLILEDGCYPHKKKAYCFDCYETIRSKN